MAMTMTPPREEAVSRWRFSVAEYEQLAESGLFLNRRLELLDGEVMAMAAVGVRHATCIRRLVALLSRKLGNEIVLSIQLPLRLDDSSEPEPDVALLSYREDFYSQSHPGPSDVRVLIEVSDSTLDYDRKTKGPAYARSGIIEYWIVNLIENRIEVYTDPTETGYKSSRWYGPEETIPVDGLPGSLPVGEIIPETTPLPTTD